jgi:hypothetical protein
MRGFMSTAIAATVLGLAAASGPAAALANEFDGDWTVRVVTERGTCDHSSSYNVVVLNGVIHYTTVTSLSMHGTVTPRGAVIVNLTHHEEHASGSGHLLSHSGGGGWHGVGKDGACSGRWEAHRR